MEAKEIKMIECKPNEFEVQKEKEKEDSDFLIDKFVNLGPIDCIDSSIYDEALKFALEDKDVTNVAITGGYGSGKTSFINSYKKRHGHVDDWIDVSFSQFEWGNDDSIQRAVINQIIYQIDKNDIKLSKFGIQKTSILKDKIMVLGAIILLICVLYLNNLSLLHSIFYPIIKTHYELFYNFIVLTRIHLFFPVVLFLICLGLTIYKLIGLFEQHKLTFSLSFLGGTMEGDSRDSKDSYIDDNLKEIVYVLEKTKKKVLVFQDLDRLSEKLILSKLRELSQLVKRKSGEELKFLYLLRDDVFLSEEFTKFFDFTIPILPHLDSNNAYDRLFTEIKRVVQNKKLITRKFMKSVSPYIENSRMLKNISNDYLIYKHKLNIGDTEIQNLYGVMILKNILPLEVRELMASKGVLYRIVDSKSKIIEAIPDVITGNSNKRTMYSQSLMDLIKLFNNGIDKNESDWISRTIYTYLDEKNEGKEIVCEFTVIRESVNLIRYLFESGMITEFNYLRLLSDSKDSVLSPRDRSFLDSQFQPKSLGYNYRLDDPTEVVNEIEFEDMGVNSLNVDYINAIHWRDDIKTRMIDIILENNEFDILLEKDLDINVVKSLLSFHSIHNLVLLNHLLEKTLSPENESLFLHFSLPVILLTEYGDNIKQLIEKHCTIDSMRDYLSIKEIIQLSSTKHIRLERILSEKKNNLLNLSEYDFYLDVLKNILFVFSVSNFNVIVSIIKKESVVNFCENGIEIINESGHNEINNYLSDQIIELITDLKKQGLKLNDNAQTQTNQINRMKNSESVEGYMEVQINNELVNLTDINDAPKKKQLVQISAYKKNWINFFHIFEFFQAEIDIVNSLNINSDFLINDKYDLHTLDSENDNIEKFLIFLTKTSKLYEEIYRSIVRKLSKPIKLTKDDQFDIDKLEILIDEKKLIFDETSMNILLSNYSKLSFAFIYQNLSEFLEFNEFDIPEGTIQKILLRDDITINQKQIIISKNKSLIILQGNNYSEDVIEYVLQNKVSPSDLNYLISYFDTVDNLSGSNSDRIMSLISENFEEFCSEEYNIECSKIGLEYLLQNLSKDMNKTINLLMKFKEPIFLDLVNRNSAKRPLVPYSERNNLISRKIHNLGLSYTPSVEKKLDSEYIRLRPKAILIN